MLDAWQPWSGHYVVPPTVWASAHTTQVRAVFNITRIHNRTTLVLGSTQNAYHCVHTTTQFAAPGWTMLHDASGDLAAGGSYLTMLSPDGKDL